MDLSKYTYFDLNSAEKDLTQSLVLPSINESSMIRDSRLLKDFKLQTFGGYQKSQVTTALDKAIQDEKIEEALLWTFQLYFSGIIESLLWRILHFSCKQICIHNPKLTCFLYHRFLKWKRITNNTKFQKDDILLLRNHPELRNIIVELITVLTLSKKRKAETATKVKKQEFIVSNFRQNLEATNNKFINSITKDGDPNELKIAANEMAYQMFKNNLKKTLYWMNWIIEWDKINTKRYGEFHCGSRRNEDIDIKFSTNSIWLIWDVIFIVKKAKTQLTGNEHPELNRQITALWKLFTYQYVPSQRSKRLPLLIWCIHLLTEKIDWEIPIIDRPYLIYQSILTKEKLISRMKSQQIQRNIVNDKLMNIAIENNYLIPSNQDLLRQKQALKAKKEADKNAIRQKKEREKEAKKKKTTIFTLNKLDELNSLDKSAR
jgi:hypothetical protein